MLRRRHVEPVEDGVLSAALIVVVVLLGTAGRRVADVVMVVVLGPVRAVRASEVEVSRATAALLRVALPREGPSAVNRSGPDGRSLAAALEENGTEQPGSAHPGWLSTNLLWIPKKL